MNLNWCKYWIAVALLLCAFVSSGAEQHWYFVRHFEKLSGEDPALTVKGHQRAQSLARYFAHIPLIKIYSTDYRRTRQSVQPLAKLLGIEVEYYSAAELEDFASSLGDSDRVLVVGHSNTTPELVRLMGGQAKAMSEQDYGRLFILSKDAPGTNTQSVILPFGL